MTQQAEQGGDGLTVRPYRHGVRGAKEHEQVGDVARGGTEQGNMLAV